jgi:hypothetical protein
MAAGRRKNFASRSVLAENGLDIRKHSALISSLQNISGYHFMRILLFYRLFTFLSSERVYLRFAYFVGNEEAIHACRSESEASHFVLAH